MLDIRVIYDILNSIYGTPEGITPLVDVELGIRHMLDSSLRGQFPQGTFVHWPVSKNDSDPANSRVYMVNWNLAKERMATMLHSARVPISMHRKHILFCHYTELVVIPDQNAAREKWSGANV